MSVLDVAAGTLIERLAAGPERAAFTFGGQGVDALGELAALAAQRPEVRGVVELGRTVLDDAASSPLGEESGCFRHGFDVGAWVDDPDGAPPAAYLRSSAVSYPLILLAQAALWRALCEDGLDAVTPVAVAGHSQGVLAALMVAEAGGRAPGDDLLARYLRLAWALGTHLAAGACDGAPMAAISGVRADRLELDDLDATVALVNTPRRLVVSGPPAALRVLRARLAEQARREQEERRRGQRGGAPLRFEWTDLAVAVPYHSPALERPLRRFEAWLAEHGELPDPAALALPVLDPATGKDVRETGVRDAVARGQFTLPVRWDVVARRLAELGADWVLDLGPGTAVAQLTAENLRGTGARTLGLASPDGRRVLATPASAPAGPDVRYADLAPRAVELPDGRHVDNRYTRATGRPPVILAGMTPTTVDAPIVAAAANAGYMAELAGGGQPDRRTLERRLAELAERLEPGREVVFNTLLLDRHLWELHISRDALLFSARRAGAPIAGLTVSAGIPEVDEAIELLDRLAAHGMRLNAFKPGTVDQVRQVLAIADAAPHHRIALHLEGGRGGGHHSWEDLDELLLDTYHEVRRRDGVLLCAGGGVATPERAADLLCGTWSLRYGEPAMPVDAVLIGTAAMACAEAAASPQVKRALVAAAGSADWVPRGGRAGGVTSATSNLNADIHLLDNAAAAAGHLLQEVAGDADAVAARREEIVAALAPTAKPYFGDVEAMTYREVLARFTALCATGRGGRYDDGAWGHPTWRERALALHRRFAARLVAEEAGPVEVPVTILADLDDPAAALATLREPAATTLLHPADAQFFLEVCDRPGKPVPFVPVLDAEVRRWYMGDALWQAQDDRLEAEGVIVIPGPDSVRGIVRADEPVGELLARFEGEALRRLDDVVERDRLADPGPLPEPLAAAIRGRRGPVAALCAAGSVLDEEGRARPNPLWSLLAPGDEVVTYPAEGELERLEARPTGRPDEHVIVEAVGDEVVVTAAVAALDGPAIPLVLAFRGPPFAEQGGGQARAAFARGALVAGTVAAVADPMAPAEVSWTCPPERIAAYRAATGAAHDGVPADLALTLAWPALAAVLAAPDLAARLSELVHSRHEVHAGAAWPPRGGERGSVVARITELADPADAPTRIVCRAELECDRGALATVVAELLITGGPPVTAFELRRRAAHDAAVVLAGEGEAGFLAARPWLRMRPGAAPPAGGETLRVLATTAIDRERGGATVVRCDGVVERDGAAIADVALDDARGDDDPVGAALDLLVARPVRHPRPRLPLASAEDAAPETMRAFARIGGDRNPLHRSVLAARLAGLDRPIAHGAWTAARASAFVAAEVCGGDADALRSWRVSFLEPVPLGAELELAAERIGLEQGRRVVEVRVSAGDAVVALGEALVDPPRTALLFPGQGIQQPGLGAAGRTRSRAARDRWEEADAITRERLGFSVLDVVDRNPGALRLADGRVLRHPEGVLARTEITQVALVALASAQLAELRAEGAVGDDFIACGHSVGEFAALHALGVLDLASALELVFRRGEAMQAHVPRDASGASRYRFAVADPQAIGLAGLEAAVADVRDETDEVLEIVNHNAAGRQYGVAGTAAAIAALERRLGRAVRPVPGIDVPFHSSVLAGAADELRGHLEALLGRVDGARLAGRWIPNATGRPFAPGDDAIDLLARQVASPVRWVDTQRALVAPAEAGGLGVRRLIEVAPAHAAVLTGLARTTYEALELPPPELLHAERDREAVLGLDEPPAPVEAEPEEVVAAPAAPVADRPLDAGTALRLVLAVQARVRLDQLDDDEPVDDLFLGVSSRRNQVLIDLGRELGLSGGEGVQRRPVGELATALREHGTHYRYPGPYLRDTVGAGLTRALGRSGVSRAEAAAHLGSAWGLGTGLVDHVLATLALESREGPSARGGELGRLAGEAPSDRAGARELLDRAAALTATELGIVLARPKAPAVPAADPAAAVRVEGALMDAARALAAGLGRAVDDGEPPAPADPDAERLAVLDAELGAGRADEIAPRFDARRHVRFASSWAAARWDLVTAYHDALAGRLAGEALQAEADRLALHGDEPAVAATSAWLASAAPEGVSAAIASVARARRTPLVPPGERPAVSIADDGAVVPGTAPAPDRPRDLIAPGELAAPLESSLEAAPDFSRDVAVVTGASPGSIGAELVRQLLRGGATVVVATSTDDPARRRWYRELYRTAAAPGAELHVLPANLASFADVDALAAWLRAPAAGRRGAPDPLRPTLLAPFAAMPSAGDLDAAGPGFETALRLGLLGVQRLVGAVAAERTAADPVSVLLPLSPNQGGFGGDGPYGETKAALEVMLERWRSEDWGRAVTLLAPRIGWVRGTGLMGASDAVAALVEERLGVRTFSAAEVGWLLAAMATPEVRAQAAAAPLEVDATGGLAAIGSLRAAVAPLAAELRDRATARRRRAELEAALATSPETEPVLALPSPGTDVAPRRPAAATHALDPADLVVIVGADELGPGGSGRTRFALELTAPGESLPPRAVGELAWLCGLAAFEIDRYRGRWVDAETRQEVPEERLAERYGARVAERIGLRPLEADGIVDPAGLTVLAPVTLDGDVAFDAGSEEEARSFLAADPERTELRRDPETGAWRVHRRGGMQLRAPRLVPHERRVAGQLPKGLDLARQGIPADLMASIDRMALVNLACTAGAFADAGIEPEELLAAVHPAMVANTQGSGMGGMASLRRLLLDSLLGEPRRNDRLQEALGNVVAAHAVQAYVGSYGPMVHPVAACATAAVSLEEAHDKIRAGKALAVLAGGYDDLTTEGLVGFGDMGATAAAEELEAMGLAPHEASRANDERRCGFVEAQGGGAMLVVRGDVALELGLPVRGVLVYAGSFADGIHASIPAAGMGVLASAGPLAVALERHGLTADDIAVVSKHDTSTDMNDPNEADLHERIQTELGRTPGNPLLVVSQKTVTGHAKGGAAAWQVDGLLRIMETGVVPGNRNLESADPILRDATHLALGDRPIAMAEPVRAGLVTSLGFGHVSALLAIAHPDVFAGAVPAERRDDYLRRAGRRRAEGEQRRLRAQLGRAAPVRRTDRRLGTDDTAAAREAEAAMLTDPAARLQAGAYAPGARESADSGGAAADPGGAP